jgi:5-(carboxyamino)imidazole ribonucleotide synthase
MSQSSLPRIGILGGGQLGRMLLQAAANYPVETHVLENDPECPAAHLCHHFTRGDIRKEEDVYNFGKNLDGLTIEIENVNTAALERLEKEGLRIFPRPSAIKTIRNKILQKGFYREHKIPSAGFFVTHSLEELKTHEYFLPAVHKIGEGGYDGRGVQIMASAKDLEKGFDQPAVLEKKISIQKEISVIVALDRQGRCTAYPPVEMIVDPVLNLLDYQFCPAGLDKNSSREAADIAKRVAINFNSPGIYAVEMFLDKEGRILVNETAPRVHNSGHHTIEANHCSQFDMLWRIMLDYPPGNTAYILPSVMINIVGAKPYEGQVHYSGLEEVLGIENCYVHIYGKKQTRHGRKMGHVTLLGEKREELISKAKKIKETLLPVVLPVK